VVEEGRRLEAGGEWKGKKVKECKSGRVQEREEAGASGKGGPHPQKGWATGLGFR